MCWSHFRAANAWIASLISPIFPFGIEQQSFGSLPLRLELSFFTHIAFDRWFSSFWRGGSFTVLEPTIVRAKLLVRVGIPTRELSPLHRVHKDNAFRRATERLAISTTASTSLSSWEASMRSFGKPALFARLIKRTVAQLPDKRRHLPSLCSALCPDPFFRDLSYSFSRNHGVWFN